MAETASSSEQEQVKCLDALDLLRAEGIGHDIDLPQMVVVGEQSSGKSSVVESITGAPLPKDEGLCTKFPTILTIRHAITSKVNVSIVPSAGRNNDESQRLRRFSGTVTTLDSIGPLITDATREIEAGTALDTTFRRDSLMIHFSGPRCLNLTIVDLPGLFQTSGEGQTEEDAEFVGSMINDYINRPRTTIIVVVPAQNQLVNQVALRVVKRADPTGSKTIGVITKPDLLSAVAEPQKFQTYMSLLVNEQHQFKHGWHVLKNRGPGELQLDMAGRDKAERKFFSNPDWKDVAAHLKGVKHLGGRLCGLQWSILQDSIPCLVTEAEAKLGQLRLQLQGVGSDVMDQKNKLLAISHGVSRELSKAYNQRYTNGGNSRLALRGNVTNVLSECSKHLTSSHAPILTPGAAATRQPSEELVQQVLQEIHNRNTMPGQIDAVLVADLFREQTKHWPTLVTKCVEQIVAFTEQCLATVVENATAIEHADLQQGILDEVATPAVHSIRQQLRNMFSSTLDGRVDGTEIDLNLEVYDEVGPARADYIRTLAAAQFDDERVPRYREQFLDAIQRAALDVHSFTAFETIACAQVHLKAEAEKLMFNLKVDSVLPIIRRELDAMLTPHVINQCLSDDQMRAIFNRQDDPTARSEAMRKIESLGEATATLKSALPVKLGNKRSLETNE